jgi:hypothetical protein
MQICPFYSVNYSQKIYLGNSWYNNIKLLIEFQIRINILFMQNELFLNKINSK